MSNWRLQKPKFAAARIAPMYCLPFRTIDRGAGQLTVGEIDAVLLRGVAQHRQRVVADLVAETARAGMNHHANLSFSRPTPGNVGVENLIHDLDFQEMVARAERSALLRAAGLTA